MAWPRIAALVLVLGGALWAGLATAAWAHFRWNRNLANISWLDTSLPRRWPTIRVAIGEHYLAEAERATRQRDFPRALMLYRAGLTRSPANAEARLSLARIYAASGRPELAKSLLLEHIERFAGSPAYLDAVLRLLLDFHYDQDLATTCDRLLARALDRPARTLVALYAATLAHLRGNHDRAESLLLVHGVDQTAEGTLLLAQIDWARGFPDLALLRLSGLVNTDAVTDQTFVLIGQIRRALGQSREVELNAAQRLAHSPLSFQPRIDFLQIHHDHRNADALTRDIESYLAGFATDQAALLALADFAANTGQPALAQRVERHFHSQGWSVVAPQLLTAEAHLIAGNPTRSLELIVAIARDAERDPRFGPVLDGLHAVTLFDLNRPDEARLHLEHLLTWPNLRAENLQAVATRLIARGHARHAQQLLSRAVVLDPLNQAALTDLVRLEAQSRTFDTLPAHVRRLLQMRRPSHDALEQVRRAWGSDLNLFHSEQAALLAELDQALNRRAAGRP